MQADRPTRGRHNLTQASAAIENLTGINIATVFSNALDNANLTGSAEERAIQAREPDTVAVADVNVVADEGGDPATDDEPRA